MRIASLTTAALALATLAACNQQPEVSATNATPAEVEEKVAAATAGGDGVMVQPGRWEGTATMREVDIPGLPAEAREQMKAQMSRATKFVSCVTEEDVKQQKAFFTGEQDDKNCKYDHFTLSGGKIDAAMHCDNGQAGKMRMTMNGSYGPDSYRMDMDSRAEGGESPMGAMTVKMSVEAKRVGVCKGTPDES
jgi:hypothetical protein